LGVLDVDALRILDGLIKMDCTGCDDDEWLVDGVAVSASDDEGSGLTAISGYVPEERRRLDRDSRSDAEVTLPLGLLDISTK
jgi:hypothetical protein